MRLAATNNYELIEEESVMKIICKATNKVMKEGFELCADALKAISLLESEEDDQYIDRPYWFKSCNKHDKEAVY